MKIKDLAILIASVIALLLILIAITSVYIYIDASKNGNVLISNIDKMPQTSQLGELMDLQLTALVPWGQEIDKLDLNLHNDFITAGEPLWSIQKYSLKGRVCSIKLPIRAIRTGKSSIGTLSIGINRPMYHTAPTKIQLDVELPTIEVAAREIAAGEKLPLAGELSKKSPPFPRWLTATITAVILLLTGTFLWCFRKKLFCRPSEILTPWEKAKKRLQELLDSANSGEKTPEWCIQQLTDLLRDYLAERFDLPICQQTTGEFFDSLRNNPSILSIEQASYLEDFLSHADLIKFACFRAAPEQHLKAIDRAGKMIDETAANNNKSLSETSTEQVK